MPDRPPEALLHDLWAHGLLSPKPLQTTTGERIHIIHPGEANQDAGPDFLNACLLMDDTRWYGSVELHVRSSEWTAHGHHRDPRYNSVILHVVLEADAATGSLRRADGTLLPELVLASYLSRPLRTLLYTFYRRTPQPIPCAAQWHKVPDSVRQQWLERLGHTRFQQRAERIQSRLAQTAPDQLLYEMVLTALGYGPNAEPMALLATRLPLNMLRALSTLQDIEAALLGVAGLLDQIQPGRLFTPEQCNALRIRFVQLQSQLDVEPLPTLLWKPGRLRPMNRPERRLVQAAVWLAPGGWLRQQPIARLHAALRNPRPLTALRRLLCHPASRAPLGRQRAHILLINALFPFLLATGALHPDQLWALLRKMPPEQDRITRHFAQLSCYPTSGFDSQALHQLYREYCQQWRCLQCAIGRYLFQ